MAKVVVADKADLEALAVDKADVVVKAEVLAGNVEAKAAPVDKADVAVKVEALADPEALAEVPVVPVVLAEAWTQKKEGRWKKPSKRF